MAAKVICSFLPNLVTAISDCIQPVSDQCLAKGLVSESVYKRVLESGGTSEDKARTLILAVKKSTETDSRCLEILLNILEEQLPHAIKDKLLSEIREEQENSRAVVPSFHLVPVPNFSRETEVVQSSLLGRLEDSIRQHERACSDKRILEETLKAKTEECARLNSELEAMKSQNDKAKIDAIADAQRRIADCEKEISNLEVKFSELEKTIEEQAMKVKRGRNMVILMTGEFFKMALHEKDTKIRKMEAESAETYATDSLKQIDLPWV